MVLIKYLQALPDPVHCSKFEEHYRLALGTAPLQALSEVLYPLPPPLSQDSQVPYYVFGVNSAPHASRSTNAQIFLSPLHFSRPHPKPSHSGLQ